MEESPARSTKSPREMERVGVRVRFIRQVLRKMRKCPREKDKGDGNEIR